jgi:hypothetical protein
MSSAVGSLAMGALEFVALVAFGVLSIVAYAKYTGTDPQTNVNKFKKNCGPGTSCSDAVLGLQKGGRSRKTRRNRK